MSLVGVTDFDFGRRCSHVRWGAGLRGFWGMDVLEPVVTIWGLGCFGVYTQQVPIGYGLWCFDQGGGGVKGSRGHTPIVCKLPSSFRGRAATEAERSDSLPGSVVGLGFHVEFWKSSSGFWGFGI